MTGAGAERVAVFGTERVTPFEPERVTVSFEPDGVTAPVIGDGRVAGVFVGEARRTLPIALPDERICPLVEGVGRIGVTFGFE